MSSRGPIRLGTRGSKLARWQADHVEACLRELGYEVEQVLITTSGDVTQGSLRQTATQGFFTKEIQRALLDEEVDLAVHSLKDLPTETVEGLELAAVPQREDPFDAFVSNQHADISELPNEACVGTGSTRRKTQLLHARPDLRIEEIRGNVDTRLKKLDEGQYDAIILAVSGLRRLGLTDRIRQAIPSELMLPAVGQGALGLEVRSDDKDTISAVAKLSHFESLTAVTTERSLLRTLRGGCLAPVAAWSRVDGEVLILEAVVLSEDGAQRLFASGTESIADFDAAESQTAARELGERVAAELNELGAAELIRASREQ